MVFFGANYKYLMENSNLVNTIAVKFNSKNDEIVADNRNVILNDEYIWLRQSIQKVTKISDYEYKVYQLYFLTEKELDDETDFKLSFKNILLINQAEKPNEIKNIYFVNTEHNKRAIPIDDVIEVNLSKKDAKNNSKIYHNNQEVTYKTMTQKIDEIKVTPLQIIVKLNLTTTDVSSITLRRSRDPNYIGFEEYKAFDENGNRLSSYSFRKSQIITYEDGTQEEWGAYDIGTNNDFENAIIEVIEYIIIEKTDSLKYLKIIPTISNDVEDVQEQKIKKVIDELDEFNIELD